MPNQALKQSLDQLRNRIFIEASRGSSAVTIQQAAHSEIHSFLQLVREANDGTLDDRENTVLHELSKGPNWDSEAGYALFKEKTKQWDQAILCYQTVIQELIRMDSGCLMARNTSEQTPLFMAVEIAHSSILAKTLIKGGADPQVRDNEAHHVLHVAMSSVDTSISLVETLLDELSEEQIKALLKEQDLFGQTPLHLLCLKSVSSGFRDQVAILQLLLRMGADPNQVNLALESVLHLAARHVDAQLLQVIVTQSRYPLKMYLQDYKGNTSLHHVTLSNYSKTASASTIAKIQCLLKAGADLDLPNYRYQTARSLCEAFINKEVFKSLFSSYPLKTFEDETLTSDKAKDSKIKDILRDEIKLEKIWDELQKHPIPEKDKLFYDRIYQEYHQLYQWLTAPQNIQIKRMIVKEQYLEADIVVLQKSIQQKQALQEAMRRQIQNIRALSTQCAALGMMPMSTKEMESQFALLEVQQAFCLQMLKRMYDVYRIYYWQNRLLLRYLEVGEKYEAEIREELGVPQAAAMAEGHSAGLLGDQVDSVDVGPELTEKRVVQDALPEGVPPVTHAIAQIKGLEHIAIERDIDSLYRAIMFSYPADQQRSPAELRNQIADYVEAHLAELSFIRLIPGHTITEYTESIRTGRSWPDWIEIEVLSRIFGYPILVIYPDHTIGNPHQAQLPGEPVFLFYVEGYFDRLLETPDYVGRGKEILHSLLPLEPVAEPPSEEILDQTGSVTFSSSRLGFFFRGSCSLSQLSLHDSNVTTERPLPDIRLN